MLRHRTSRCLRLAAAFLRAGAIALAALVPTAPAAAKDAVVVRTSDESPYVAASDAAIERLRDAGVRVTAALLADVSADALRGADAPRTVIAIGTEAAVAAQARAGDATSVVYCLVSDPARAGLLGDPQVHGVSTETPLDRHLELMAQVVPRTRVVGALYRSSEPTTIDAVDALRRAAPRSWSVEAVDIDAYPSIAAAIDAVFATEIDFFWTSPERSIYDQATIRQLLLTSLRSRTPVFGFSEAFVRAGALVGVSVSPTDQGRHAAEIALEVGLIRRDDGQAPPANEPTHHKATARVALNRLVAEKLGLTLPAGAMADADSVYGE